MHGYAFRKTVVFPIMLIPAPTIHNDTKWQLCLWGGGMLSALLDVYARKAPTLDVRII